MTTSGLARPGGNVTGTTSYAPELVPKAIELLRELVPSVRHLAVLALSPFIRRKSRQGSSALTLTLVGVEGSGDLDPPFARIEQAHVDALYVHAEPMRCARTRHGSLRLRHAGVFRPYTELAMWRETVD